MSAYREPNPKFSVDNKVIADNDIATIKQIIYPADSDKWFGKVSYAVEWATGEWGTFDEDELAEINNEAR